MNLLRKLWRRGRNLIPSTGFHFDRPIVLIQSDDWGRVGLRDQEGREELHSAGLTLGDLPYDLYTLETAEDLSALSSMLMKHRDSSGRSPVVEMNFVSANLDFAKMRAGGFQQIHLLPLSDGLPQGWNRPGLVDAYRSGVASGVFYPALHGTTHFCRAAVERNLAGDEARANLLRTLWQAGTPYIYPRMPWIGYEYWDPEQPEEERFLSREAQRVLIGQTVGEFAKLFSTLPRSACAPGYRANEDTHRAWAQHGIRIAQNGSGAPIPPHFDGYGLLNLYRGINFEPAMDAALSVDAGVERAEAFFRLGLPAVVSIHSINFHSSVRDSRSGTLGALHQFLGALESRHNDLLYLHDDDLYELITKGSYGALNSAVQVKVTRTGFIKALAGRRKLSVGAAA